jgi:hypothetical protein
MAWWTVRPKVGWSTVAAWMVRACTESVRIPRFLRDLLPIFARLAREPTCNGSRPPHYIDEGVQSIEPHNRFDQFYLSFLPNALEVDLV